MTDTYLLHSYTELSRFVRKLNQKSRIMLIN